MGPSRCPAPALVPFVSTKVEVSCVVVWSTGKPFDGQCPAVAAGPANGLQVKARGVTMSDQEFNVPVSTAAWSEAGIPAGAVRRTGTK
jgi:hypothetical protein